MEFALPQIGEGVYEAELVRWLVEPGTTVKRGQPLLEVLTDKATMEVPSPFVGGITELRAEPGQQLRVGEVILTYTSATQPVPVVAAPKSVVPHTNGPIAAKVREDNGRLPVKAAPSVRARARALGVDLATVTGSGPEGRVLIEDLREPPPNSAAARTTSAPKHSEFGTPGKRIKLQGLRRRIAEHMVRAKQTIPHYSLIEECDVSDLVKLREGLKERFAGSGVKLTYLAFFVKAVVAALKEVPLVNASLDEDGGEIVLHDRYHIGIAVATPAGLVVPVVHDADKIDFAALAREIDRLVADARTVRSKRDDLRGGTFTVTSVGNVGGLIATPIVNHPEVGILGLGRVVKRPVYDEHDQIRPAHLMYLSLSFDHRVVDGAIGAVFINAVLRQMRNPAALLLPTTV